MRFYVGLFFASFLFTQLNRSEQSYTKTIDDKLVFDIVFVIFVVLCSLLVVFVYFFVSLLSSLDRDRVYTTDRFSNLMAFIYLFIILVLLLLLYSLVFFTHTRLHAWLFQFICCFSLTFVISFQRMFASTTHRKTMYVCIRRWINKNI